jgi:hypothetical protein
MALNRTWFGSNAGEARRNQKNNILPAHAESQALDFEYRFRRWKSQTAPE